MADEVYPSRRKARKHAIEVGYAALLRDAPAMELLAASADAAGWRSHPWFAYCQEIVAGVADHATELDELLQVTSAKWSIERMSTIDRAILRVGAWELEHSPLVPPAAAISEAVHLAHELSSEEAGRFVNGVLGAIAAQRS